MYAVQYDLNGIWLDLKRGLRSQRRARDIQWLVASCGARARVIAYSNMPNRHRPGYAMTTTPVAK